MRRIFLLKLILMLTAISCSSFGKTGAKNAKVTFIKSFVVKSGFPASNPVGDSIKDYIIEEFIKTGRYLIVEEAVIKATMKQGEKVQAIEGCSDDYCMKTLMTKTDADVFVYGTVKKTDGYIQINARLMENSGGVTRLKRIRIIRFKYEDMLERGSRSLGKYLATGDLDDVEDFTGDAYEREVEEQYSEKLKNIEEENARVDRDTESYIKRVSEERKNRILRKSAKYRFGYGYLVETGDSAVDKYYNDKNGFLFDWIFRLYGSRGFMNFDYTTRFCYYSMKMNNPDLVPVEEAVFTEDMVKAGSINIFAVDFSFRLRKSVYYFMTQFDFYVPFAGRYQYLKESAANINPDKGDNSVSYFSMGAYTGCGVEVAFFESLGFYIEYIVGYTPVGESKVNFSKSIVQSGITYRTF